MQYLRVILAIAAICFGVLTKGCAIEGRQTDPPAHGTAANTTEKVNINTASEEELRRLPHVGEALAAAITEHRTLHGPFRKPEHLMLVKGISDGRFRRMKHLIRTE